MRGNERGEHRRRACYINFYIYLDYLDCLDILLINKELARPGCVQAVQASAPLAVPARSTTTSAFV